VPRFSLPLITLSALLVAQTTASIAQTLPPDIPLGIVCYSQKTQTWMVGYLNTVNDNGTATFRGGMHVANLNADRKLVPTTDRATVLDCYGKTLDELRTMGRLIPLQRTPAGK
jgi:hypothetical protein